ncbi:hypothetical protein W97_00915 [Coniosporium apollinis CBS 100218]|uniref:General transcription and DNA repair factor IIH n=1 Tax=Coniosporium apollinis (strain CBS 100218) TaxID=1168221 RepID=R7YIT5_CONA1|nr:uncharacterized protein W97_00915 [Coniosporium apollinis CBS 100218]EON61699.1 hypothetical protein W97_00915 [Coniosporium apollinis CBS 100218]
MDGEYIQDVSDDDGVEVASRSGNNGAAGGAYGARARGRTRAKERWESGIQADSIAFGEGPDGNLAESLEAEEQARKRARLRQDNKPVQRGIIRHVVLILDLSEAMLEKDMRPNRYIVTINHAQAYVREFFEQNPISQMCVMAMHDGLCIRLSDLSGNPADHIAAIQGIRYPKSARQAAREPKGSPSLQNALEMARAALYHAPSHSTREVIIVLGALLSNDPGDIHKTIKSCVNDRLRVAIIGMGARLRICQEICAKTNAGDDSVYGVCQDEKNLRELLMATTTPPVIRQTAPALPSSEPTPNAASLLMMGFPSRVTESTPSLCACHNNLTRGGYMCSRCQVKVCSLPRACPSCGMTLILSTHLARSYHHLFPLQSWVEVSWKRARELGSTECQACMTHFPPVPEPQEPDAMQEGTDKSTGTDTANGAPKPVKQRPRAEGASESSRYECRSCHCHFCIDCDVYCHTVLHNCPGCLSNPNTAPTDAETNPEVVAEMAAGLENGVNGGEPMDME